MKHIKRFNENNNSLEELCKIYIDGHKYNRERIEKGALSYNIRKNGFVDVNGDLTLELYDIDIIPIKFGKTDTVFISGDITTLKNSPRSVKGALNVMSCPKLTSLEGAPEYISSWLHCGSAPLDNLTDIPKPFESRNQYKLTFSKSNYHSLANVIKLFIEPTERYSNEFIINEDSHNLIELFNEYDPIRENNTVVLDRLNNFLSIIGKDTVTEVYGYNCI